MNLYSSNAPKNLGIMLTGAWLILIGVISVIDLSFSGMDLVTGILALAAGIALILDLYR
jgi:hypothetical protein